MPTAKKLKAFQLGLDDWEQYTKKLEQYFTAIAVDDANKKQAVLTGGRGEVSLKSPQHFIGSAKPASKSYEELVSNVHAHLKPKEWFHFHLWT